MDKTVRNKLTKINNLIYDLYKQWKNGEIESDDIAYILYLINQSTYKLTTEISNKRERERNVQTYTYQD